MLAMPDYSDELRAVISAVSFCPDCSGMAFAYRSTDRKRDNPNQWDFMCPRCGIDFVMPESESLKINQTGSRTSALAMAMSNFTDGIDFQPMSPTSMS